MSEQYILINSGQGLCREIKMMRWQRQCLTQKEILLVLMWPCTAAVLRRSYTVSQWHMHSQ